MAQLARGEWEEALVIPPHQDLKKPLNPAGYWVVPCPISPPCPLQPGVDRGNSVLQQSWDCGFTGSVLLVGWGGELFHLCLIPGGRELELSPMFTGALWESLTFSAHREYIPDPKRYTRMGYEPTLPSKFSSPAILLCGTGRSEDGQKW